MTTSFVELKAVPLLVQLPEMLIVGLPVPAKVAALSIWTLLKELFPIVSVPAIARRSPLTVSPEKPVTPAGLFDERLL